MVPKAFDQENEGLVNRGMLEQAIGQLKIDLITGRVQIPVPAANQLNLAGGTNHYPNSDIDYSTDARTIAGTLPADAGDGNQEVWRHSRQMQTDDIVVDAAHALKAVGHSLYAADEGVNPEVPDWNRVDGWIEIGSGPGNPQYDIAVELLAPLVGPGDTWFVLFRSVALDAALVPADVEAYFGVWEQRAADEGWVTGGPFDLDYEIIGVAGATNIDYRVLAKTDSGVSILSNILNVSDAPAVLSAANYPKLYHNAGPGFIEYEIYRLRAGIYEHLFTVRNSIDLQYNDTGTAHYGVVGGWPADPGNAPQAYAKTRTLRVGGYNNAWALNELRIRVPNSYDYSQAVKQFLRFGLTAETGVDRHLGIDRLWFSTTFNEWAPDLLTPFADGTFPIKSVSPTSGSQGSSGGVLDPPPPGGGGGVCILNRMPVMVRNSRRKLVFKRYQDTQAGDEIKGQHRIPYEALEKKGGMVSEWYRIRTKNGIRYECNARHRLVLDIDREDYIEAQHVKLGVKLAGATLRGRKFVTAVTSVELIPEPTWAGTYVLRHPGGLSRVGHGIFLAGFSKKKDRALFGSNVKPIENHE